MYDSLTPEYWSTKLSDCRFKTMFNNTCN